MRISSFHHEFIIKMNDLIKARNLNERVSEMAAGEMLDFFAESCRGKICFATSLGAEDQVLTHMIAMRDIPIRVITLDTGRLFNETYSLIEQVRVRYGITIEVFFPNAEQVENMIQEKGVNLFYDSLENRHLCCKIRKKEPLKRALAGMEVWVTGLRRDQSPTRNEIEFVSWDTENSLLKINPLLNWSEAEIWDYIKKNNVSYNPLHDRGYRSIGCAPCTRAVKAGDDVRSGRWWWEKPGNKDCGLHDNFSSIEEQ